MDTVDLGDERENEMQDESPKPETIEPGRDRDAQPRGELIKLAGEDAYISLPANGASPCEKLLLFFSDGGGIRNKNNQLQADEYADQGYVVVMPDQFQKDEYTVKGTTDDASELLDDSNTERHTSLLENVKGVVASGVSALILDLWLARHSEQKTMPIVRNIVQAAKEHFTPQKTYAIGFGFGGNVLLILAGSTEFRAVAVAHPVMVSKTTVENIKTPVYLAVVDNDSYHTQQEVEYEQKILAEHNVEHEIESFGNAPHGFATKFGFDDEQVQTKREKVFKQMLTFLAKY